MKNTQQIKYPMTMIVLHGLVAVLMIATLVAGWLLDSSDSVMGVHQFLGIAVLTFAVLRIINRLRQSSGVPKSVNTKATAQYIAEKIVHGLLYVITLSLPVVGWLTVNAKGHAVQFFGLFDLPTLLAKNTDLAHQLGDMHETGANIFVALIVLHLLGGVVHLFLHKDNVFKRMMP
ncbi:MAG: cytochrome b [Formosimonas sp.]